LSVVDQPPNVFPVFVKLFVRKAAPVVGTTWAAIVPAPPFALKVTV